MHTVHRNALVKTYNTIDMHRDTKTSGASISDNCALRTRIHYCQVDRVPFPLYECKRGRDGRLPRVRGDGTGVEWREQLGLFSFLWHTQDAPLCLAHFMLQGLKLYVGKERPLIPSFPLPRHLLVSVWVCAEGFMQCSCAYISSRLTSSSATAAAYSKEPELTSISHLRCSWHCYVYKVKRLCWIFIVRSYVSQ